MLFVILRFHSALDCFHVTNDLRNSITWTNNEIMAATQHFIANEWRDMFGLSIQKILKYNDKLSTSNGSLREKYALLSLGVAETKMPYPHFFSLRTCLLYPVQLIQYT